MSQYQLLLVLILCTPLVLVTILRVNATMVFLSLCVGYAISQLLGADIKVFADMFLPQWRLGVPTIDLLLIVLPALLTMLFWLQTVKGTARILNMLPGLAVSSLCALLIVPLLPPTTVQGIGMTAVWHELARLQALLIGCGAVVCLLFLWLQRPSGRKETPIKKHASN